MMQRFCINDIFYTFVSFIKMYKTVTRTYPIYPKFKMDYIKQ